MESLYLLFGIAVLALFCAVALAVLGVRCGGRNIPVPPENLRPKGKGVKKEKECVGITLHGRIYKE